MTQVVRQYPLTSALEQTVLMPGGAQGLSIQEQYGRPCLWALVDPDKAERPYTIECYGTGYLVPPLVFGQRRHFMATVQTDAGMMALHYFVRYYETD